MCRTGQLAEVEQDVNWMLARAQACNVILMLDAQQDEQPTTRSFEARTCMAARQVMFLQVCTCSLVIRVSLRPEYFADRAEACWSFPQVRLGDLCSLKGWVTGSQDSCLHTACMGSPRSRVVLSREMAQQIGAVYVHVKVLGGGLQMLARG